MKALQYQGRAIDRVIARPCCVIKYAITTKSGNYKRVNILLPPQWVFRKTCVYLRHKLCVYLRISAFRNAHNL